MKPEKLRLLPGLRWSGHLCVVQKKGPGRYLVHWDAQTKRGTAIYDVCVMTAEQIEDWTGRRLQ